MKRKFLFIGIVVGVMTVIGWYFDPPKPWIINPMAFSTTVYSRDGRLLRLALSSDEKYRVWTPLSRISPEVVRATLAQEDRFFFIHPGVNPVALARASFQTFVQRERRIGGSTLSMQLARMRFGINTKTVLGKIRQIRYAFLLERHYSKSEILEAYLNLAPYGGNIEGVGAASIIYWKKPASDLREMEAVSLAVIPQNPKKRAPERNDPALHAARARLELRVSDGIGGQVEAPRIDHKRRSDLPFIAPHFVQQQIDRFPRHLSLRTTLDVETQTTIERLTARFLAQQRLQGVENAVVMVVDRESMAVRAHLGSADYFSREIAGQVNGTTARRSPGSALKPFIYALAIDQGLVHPGTVLKDTRMSFATYNPENFDRDYVGPVSVTEALVRSRNVPAVQLTAQLKSPTLYEFLKGASIPEMRDPEHYGLALALGGVEVTLEELVSLYAMLANGGVLRPLRTLEDQPGLSGRRVLSAESAYLTTQMLQENPRPLQGFDSQAARRSKVKVAWKTGTSFGFRDAWSVGIAGQYVIGVWVGNFSGRGNPAFVGRDLAGPLLFSIVDGLFADSTLDRRILPTDVLNVTQVEVCALSGAIPGPGCKHRRKVAFIPGKSPISACAVHRQILVRQEDGQRECLPLTPNLTVQTMEYWPSDVRQLFQRVGLPRRLAPPWRVGCAGNTASGAAPQISSPQSSLVYALTGDFAVVPLSAVTDQESRHLYWFVDDAAAGVSRPGETILWRSGPGRFAVRVVDEAGRAASSSFVVTGVSS